VAEPRVGIIGAGFIGRFHAAGISRLVRQGLVKARYVGVCDLEEERARQFAETAGLDLSTTDPDELIGSDEIDTVYVCTPTRFHKELVLKVAGAGKNVFCEKPLARNLPDARTMYGAVRTAGIRHQVVLRHAPVFNVMKHLMSDPGLGRPMAVLFRDDQFFPIRGLYESTWRKDYEMSGGGTLIEHSIHDLDLLRWLIGEVASLRAVTGNLAGHPGVEDLASVWLRFENGCTGHLVSIWHNVLSRPSGRLIEIFFENGYFATENDFFGPLRYETCASGGSAVLATEEVQRRYREMAGVSEEVYQAAIAGYAMEDYFFLKALEGRRTPFPGFEVGVRAHVLVDAVYRSAAEDREVDIPGNG
jgi:UDP-N-acetyl-2-amino-2-deoxyglucuronate dehydrogenase